MSHQQSKVQVFNVLCLRLWSQQSEVHVGTGTRRQRELGYSQNSARRLLVGTAADVMDAAQVERFGLFAGAAREPQLAARPDLKTGRMKLPGRQE